MKHPTLFLPVLLFSTASHAGELVVVADAKAVKDTGATSMEMCMDDNDCVPWRTFYLYEIKVEKILQGHEDRDTFHIVVSQHTGINDGRIRGRAFVLDKIETNKGEPLFPADYKAVSVGHKMESYCFYETRPEFEAEPYVRKKESANQYCYDVDNIW